MQTKKKKWITYGVAGALGLTLIGGAAAATAANMDLRTGDGAVVPGGPVVGSGDVLDRDKVKLRVTDTSASVVSVASANSPKSAPSVNSPKSAPSVNSPNSPISVLSAPSPVAPAKAPAPVHSPNSPDSPDSPASPASVASADSD